MSDTEKHPIFVAAEAAFDSELLGAVAMAAAERLDETENTAFAIDAAALANLLGPDTAWERYGAPAVDVFVHDLLTLRSESI
jgi:hypothetical protein